jgi:hypothetical protein
VPVGEAALVTTAALLGCPGSGGGRLVGALTGFHGELLQQAPLPGTQACGHRDIDQDVQIATHPRPTQMRHAPAAQPDLGTRLGARLDLHQLLAVGCRHRHAGTERRLADGYAQLEVQLGVLPFQARMRLDVGDHIQVARDTATGTCLALARQADLVPIVDARRDGHTERALEFRPALATTHGTGPLHDLPGTPASAAHGHVDHLAQHRGPDLADLARATALGATDGGRTRLRTVPGARLAGAQRRE